MRDFRLYATWFQRLTGLVAVAGVLALSACGGGSGAPNNPFAPKPAPAAALTIIPSSATIFSQVASALTISGGVAPYRAFSSNSAVLPVTQNLPGDTVTLLAGNVNFLTLVTITVQDSAGTQASALITILPGPATPPPALTVLPSPVDIFSGIATQLTVAGGVPPYRAFSSSPTVLPVTPNVSGSTVNLIANDVTANTLVTVTIQDSVGQNTPVTVTVHPKGGSAPPLVVLPDTVITSAGIPVTLTISGGLPPYKAFSSNPAAVPVNQSVTGNSLVFVANPVGSTTQLVITIQDSAGQTFRVSVTVQSQSTTPLGILPPSAVIFSNVPTSVTVTGGLPPYLAFSSNPTILPVLQAVAGSVIPLLATNVSSDTTVTLTVQDSANQTATATITVTAAPLLNALTITPNITTCGTQAICSGQSGTASVAVRLPGGGPAPGRQIRFDVVAGPFSIAANGASPTSPSQVVVSDAAGNATVIIRANVDAPTQPAQIRVTDIASGQQLTGSFLILQLTDGSTILTVVPAETTFTGAFINRCTSNFHADYFIYGGTPPYRVTQTLQDGTVLLNSTVNASGGFFEVVTDGARVCVNPQTFSIVDATGRQVTARLFNLPGTATPTTAPSELVVTPGSLGTTQFPILCDGTTKYRFVVTGGTAPYNAFSNNNPVNPNVQLQGEADGSPSFAANITKAGQFFDVSFTNPVSGAVNIRVFDSSGDQQEAAVTIRCQ